MRSTNRNNRTSKTAVKLLLALLFVGGLAYGQGGTGKGTSTPLAKTKPPSKPPGRNLAVANIEGTTWGFEGREGAKLLGKSVFEFLADGKLQINGDIDATARWKQIGRRVVITFSEGRSNSTMDGLITGNQIKGTMTGKGDEGENRQARFSARRADAALMAELSLWKSIKDSTNPHDFITYLGKYPYGAFVEDAARRMRTLEALKSSPSPTPPNP